MVNKINEVKSSRNKKPALKIKQEEEKGLFNSPWKSAISDETNKVTMRCQNDHVGDKRKLFCSDSGARVEVNKVNTGMITYNSRVYRGARRTGLRAGGASEDAHGNRDMMRRTFRVSSVSKGTFCTRKCMRDDACTQESEIVYAGMNPREYAEMNPGEVSGMNPREYAGMNSRECAGMNPREYTGMNPREYTGIQTAGIRRNEPVRIHGNEPAGMRRNECAGGLRGTQRGLNRGICTVYAGRIWDRIRSRITWEQKLLSDDIITDK